MPGADSVRGLWLASVAERYVPGAGPVDIQPLRLGLVNDNYRVVRGGNTFAFRVGAANSHALGLDRDWEVRVLDGAVAADLAPELVYSDPKHGILISRWANGHSWSPDDTRRSANLSRMAGFMHRIHALRLPAPTRVMTPGQWMDYYSAAGPTAGAAALRSSAVERLGELAALVPVPRVLCHSDLHTLNLIERGGSMVLLDWEYAHAADAYWDLAGWSANNDFEEETRLELLANYVGTTPTPEQCLRLRHLGWLYDYVCLLWSELYLSLYLQGGPADSGLAEVRARAQLLAARLHASK